ncbi:L-2-amino-thiazoline-4-carboxylic acid hydrolase [Haloimpatiens sp. FM7330]
MELVPQMCKFDYVMGKYMGANLKRTKTIANGDGIYDFWYTKKDD